VVGTLLDLADRAREAAIGPPATLIVGRGFR
jgi:siroheme synthase